MSSGDSRLARRLRELREREWPDVTLTQVQLARALSAQSRVASATLSTWENVHNPKTPTTARLNAYARFFATRRSLEGGPHLIAVDEFDADERERFEELEEELFALHTALGDPTSGSDDRRQLLSFGGTGPIIIVCPELPETERGALADEGNINYTRLHRIADADALFEAFGHIRALNPDRTVLNRVPPEVDKSDLQNHLVMIGGIGWNPILRRVQRQLGERVPIRQVDDSRLATGEVFQVIDEESKKPREYFPVTDESGGVSSVTEDIGLIVRLPNPFNLSRTLTICNGVHSTGVMGAVLALTDETVRPANEAFLADRYPRGEFAILARVPVIPGGGALAPDFQNPDTRLFEWAPGQEGG